MGSKIAADHSHAYVQLLHSPTDAQMVGRRIGAAASSEGSPMSETADSTALAGPSEAAAEPASTPPPVGPVYVNAPILTHGVYDFQD